MLRKIWVGASGAVLLSASVLLGGMATGLVGAQTPHAQTAPAATPEAPDVAEQDAPVSLPAGSATADQAKQAATAYIQGNAPYNAQGLQVQSVQVDDENGTAVYKVTFVNSSGQGAEVTENAQGQVLKAESDTPDANEAADTGAETAEAPGQPDADGPGGHADPPGTVDSPAGALQ